MLLTLHIPWLAIDATSPKTRMHLLRPGTYEMEQIPNPLGYTTNPWLVLKGTKIGASMAYWQGWNDGAFGDFRVGLERIPSTDSE